MSYALCLVMPSAEGILARMQRPTDLSIADTVLGVGKTMRVLL